MRSVIMAFSMYSRIPMPKIKWDEKEIELAPAVLAAADDRLFEHRPYQMILNRCVGGKMGRKEEEICI